MKIDITTAYENTAEQYKSQYNYSDAELFYLKALDIRVSLFGKKHLNTANNLATLYTMEIILRRGC